MTVEGIRQKVAEIRAAADDPESAHALEDELYEAVLRGIVAGDAYYVSLCEEALKSKEIDFPRWCA